MTRRLIMPDKSRQVKDPILVPALETLVTDAVSIIGSELARYRLKTSRGVSLDVKEARVVRDYVEALCKLTKEAREQARAEDLSNLTNEELLQLASRLVDSNSPSSEPNS